MNDEQETLKLKIVVKFCLSFWNLVHVPPSHLATKKIFNFELQVLGYNVTAKKLYFAILLQT